MSISALPGSRAAPCRTLAEYVTLLVARLAEAEPEGAARIRAIVGGRSARFTLGAESVQVAFEPDGSLRVAPDGGSGGAVDGAGATSRATTLQLLDGYREVTAAVLDGELELMGSVDDVAAMGQAIEVLLDASTRIPALQELARDFRDDPCRPATAPRRAGPIPRRTPYYPDPPDAAERALLRRLDLLP